MEGPQDSVDRPDAVARPGGAVDRADAPDRTHTPDRPKDALLTDRQRALLEHFGSVRALRSATEAEIARVPGFGPGLARVVAGYLAGEGDAANGSTGKERNRPEQDGVLA